MNLPHKLIDIIHFELEVLMILFLGFSKKPYKILFILINNS